MIPNTYHWLQSVCLPLPPTNIWTDELSDGWRAGNFSCPSACSAIPPPSSPYSTSSSFPIASQNFFFALFHLPSRHLRHIVLFPSLFGLPRFCFLCSSSAALHHPSFPFSFPLAGFSHIFACSCEGVSDVRVAHGGRRSSGAWREHTLRELPFITPSPNEQHAECNTDAITFRNSFS